MVLLLHQACTEHRAAPTLPLASERVFFFGEHLYESGAIGLERTATNITSMDVRYHFDAPPSWAVSLPEVAASQYQGRLAGVTDRALRSVMAYDARGLVTFTRRDVRVFPTFTPTYGTATDGRPVVSGTMPTVLRVYDTVHPYTRTATYDHGGRPTEMTLPIDPDYTGGGAAPRIGGRLTYNPRGLPEAIDLLRDDTPGTSMADAATVSIIDSILYARDGLVDEIIYGDDHTATGAARSPTVSTMTYDDRRRPVTMETVRASTGMDVDRPLSAVTVPFSEELTWDEADNLTTVLDTRIGSEWPDGYRPQSTSVIHDALYRVVSAEFTYTTDTGTSPTDLPLDWRHEAAASRVNDPMRSRPAPMVDGLPSSRPEYMSWDYDWIGNMTSWDDDAGQFYERSVGDITNGLEITATRGPATALRLAHNLVPAAVGADHGGWLETDYAANGDIVGLTVHANCRDDNDDTNGDAGLEICLPDPNQALAYANRTARLRDRCICAQEQHYVYRWDEANRITEAYRFERNGSNGTGPWTLIVRQRYLYDASNERIVKQTYDTDTVSGLGLPEAVTLYVFPGDFERRGLARNTAGTAYDALPGVETQYVVGGARFTYRSSARSPVNGIDRDQRLTIGLTDIIQSTSATLDLLTGELVETSNYYPNGARESYRGSTSGERVAPEPMGFTGKEADEEVGLVYFGQRYLLAHLGRWASPDPLQVHAVGGGEALNGYHYVSGNVLQARDPLGLHEVSAHEVEANRETIRSTWTERHVESFERVAIHNYYLRMQEADARARASLVDGCTSAPGCGMVNALYEPMFDEGGGLTSYGAAELRQFKDALARVRGSEGEDIYSRVEAMARQSDFYLSELAIPDQVEALMYRDLGAISAAGGMARRLPARSRDPLRSLGLSDPSLLAMSADEITEALRSAGYTVTARPSTRGSMRSTILDVTGGTGAGAISQVEVHPGGGTAHGGAYVRVSTGEGRVWYGDASTFADRGGHIVGTERFVDLSVPDGPAAASGASSSTVRGDAARGGASVASPDDGER